MATTMKMTVLEALSKIKVLNKRVDSAIREVTLVTTVKKNETKINGKDRADYEKEMVGSYQKAVDLINQINAIKAAINKYNAETMITVGGKKMSIAEAIYMKQYGLKNMESLLGRLRDQFNNAMFRLTDENGRQLDQKVDKYRLSLSGADGKLSPEAQDMIDHWRDVNTTILVDPSNISAKIAELEKQIDDLESGVDSAIQVANATNVIEITF